MRTHKIVWWVYSTAKLSKHRSAVGPFKCVIKAAKFVQQERPQKDWKSIRILGRTMSSKKEQSLVGVVSFTKPKYPASSN